MLVGAKQRGFLNVYFFLRLFHRVLSEKSKKVGGKNLIKLNYTDVDATATLKLNAR